MTIAETKAGDSPAEVEFFLFDPTSKAPTLDDLSHKAMTAKSGGELLLTLLEETGHRPSADDIDSTKGMIKEALVKKRKDIAQQIEQTNNTYQSLFFKGSKRGEGLDVDAVERLYDVTEVHDDTPVLGLIGAIRSSLPANAEAAQRNTVEADRIARLMIAQNMGNVAIGDLFVEHVEAGGSHPVS
jgi:hypothetical protein